MGIDLKCKSSDSNVSIFLIYLAIFKWVQSPTLLGNEVTKEAEPFSFLRRGLKTGSVGLLAVNWENQDLNFTCQIYKTQYMI